MTVIDLTTIRYINLLDKISNVKTSKCFSYNNAVMFAVPKRFFSKAIGLNAANAKKIQEKIGKRVKIVKEAEGIDDAERFVREIVAPVGFKSLEIKDGVVTINAGIQSKAALI